MARRCFAGLALTGAASGSNGGASSAARRRAGFDAGLADGFLAADGFFGGRAGSDSESASAASARSRAARVSRTRARAARSSGVTAGGTGRALIAAMRSRRAFSRTRAASHSARTAATRSASGSVGAGRRWREKGVLSLMAC